MIKIAVISDVHANLEELQAVKENIEKDSYIAELKEGKYREKILRKD